MAYLTTSDNIRIFYSHRNRAGSKTPIVFVHGFLADWSCFKKEIEYFIKKDHPVVYFDLRGHGNSQSPESEDAYDIDRLVDDLHAVVRKTGVTRIYLVGHSMGGIVSLLYTLQHKSIVKRLAVLNASHYPPDSNAVFKRLAGNHYLKTLYNRFVKNKKAKKILADTKMNRDYNGSRPYFIFLRLLASADLRTIFLFADELFNTRLNNLDRIRCPTLIIESSDDEFYSARTVSKLGDSISSSITKWLPGGHGMIVEHPESISLELNQFFHTPASFFNSGFVYRKR